MKLSHIFALLLGFVAGLETCSHFHICNPNPVVVPIYDTSGRAELRRAADSTLSLLEESRHTVESLQSFKPNIRIKYDTIYHTITAASTVALDSLYRAAVRFNP